MVGFLLNRIIGTVPILLVVTLFIFSVVSFAPGDPAALIAGDDATSGELDRIRETMNLDQPFLVRYSAWLVQIAQGDFGRSLFTNQPVVEMLLGRVEPTLSLMAVAMLISIVVALPTAVLAAWNAKGAIDRFLTIFSSVSFAIPVFVIGYLLAYFLGLRGGLFPVQGYTPFSEGIVPWLRHLFLPALALSTAYTALIARTARTALLGELKQDYVRTAIAKGLSTGTILFVHTLKNASVPIVTVVGLGVATLISGSVVTESVFAIPGLGRLTSDAIMRRDIPVIQGVTLIFTLSYVLVNLVIDLLYVVIDPRVSYLKGQR